MIIIVCVFVSPMKTVEDYIKLLVGYVFVVIGQTLFLIGLDSSILPIGKMVGGSLIKLKKTALIVLFGFVFGLLATVAEPALAVLAGQVHIINNAINHTLFIWILGVGIGVAVALALFRVIKDINIKLCFAVLYILTFILVFFVPDQFRALAFDGSGATTGDVSVPFILALGMGVSTTMSKSRTNDESFGIIGIASVGPIIAVFIYGMILGNGNINPYTPGEGTGFGGIVLENLSNVALAIIPIIVIFFLFQLFLIKLPRRQLMRILFGSLVVFIGLLIFLVGIDYGFALAGKHIGEAFMEAERPDWFMWLLLPVGFILGFAITLSEPAVVVLGEQVEDITNGHIKKGVIRLTLAIGIGLAALLSVLKILTDVNILWFLIPLYAISLLLLIVTPKLFVGLAFDSGGVTGGAITSAFLTPLTLGISMSLNQDILVSGFGMIAFVSVMPLIAVQVLGIIYKIKLAKYETESVSQVQTELSQLNELALLADLGEETAPEIDITEPETAETTDEVPATAGEDIKDTEEENKEDNGNE
ncbi:MAG: DUF1538 domain-containing protein [Christensenellaceae bacterium]|nr:DUF1538 domain-containing protein [Christensenellaceae bacterium]